MNNEQAQSRQIQSSLPKINEDISIYPRGRLIGGKFYKPLEREDSPAVVWDVRQNGSSSVSSFASQSLDGILDDESTRLPVIHTEGSQLGGVAEGGQDFYFSKDYYWKWKHQRGLRNDSVFAVRKAYSDFLSSQALLASRRGKTRKKDDANKLQCLQWQKPSPKNYKLGEADKGFSHELRSTQRQSSSFKQHMQHFPVPSLLPFSIPGEDAYLNMLSSHLEDSKYGPLEMSCNKPTFTCPSCMTLHWQPGRCPCCTTRPKKPVLLCLPWKSPQVASGLNPRSSLKGTKCIFHNKQGNQSAGTQCSASCLREVLSSRHTYSIFPGLHFTVSSEEMSPIRRMDKEVKPIAEEDFTLPLLQHLSRLLYNIPEKARLPSLTEDPPIFSASRYRGGSRKRSRSGRKNFEESNDAMNESMSWSSLQQGNGSTNDSLVDDDSDSHGELGKQARSTIRNAGESYPHYDPNNDYFLRPKTSCRNPLIRLGNLESSVCDKKFSSHVVDGPRFFSYRISTYRKPGPLRQAVPVVRTSEKELDCAILAMPWRTPELYRPQEGLQISAVGKRCKMTPRMFPKPPTMPVTIPEVGRGGNLQEVDVKMQHTERKCEKVSAQPFFLHASNGNIEKD